MIKPEIIDALVAAGCTAEQLAAAFKADQASGTSNAERQARYRARGGGKIPPDLRALVYERDGFACLECGADDNLCCDHAIPVSKGGETTLENLQTLCIPCNSRKKDRIRKYESRNPRMSTDIPRTFHGSEDPSPKKETSPTPPKEKTTPSKTEAKASSGCDEKFAEFWLVYPRREGPNPRKPAKLIFDRLVAKGARADALIAAAQSLANEHPSPTRFVPQAQTWLNQERFAEAEPIIPGDTFCPEENQTTRLHVIRYRNEHDGTDPPRGVQGGKAGYLIPASWVRSMQLRQANG